MVVALTMTTPDNVTFRELPSRALTDVRSLTFVESALRDLEVGMFARAAQLVDFMGRDDRFSGALGTRVRALLGLPMEFEAGGDGEDAKTVAQDLEASWWDIWPESSVAELLKWGVTLGVGLAQNVWTRTEKTWTPLLKVWHPEYLYWRQDTGSYWVVTMDGPVEVTPGDGTWVMYTPGGYGRAWMNGLVRSVGETWLDRRLAKRDRAKYSEVYGLPIRKALMPSSAKAEDKRTFATDVAALGSNSTLRLPFGEDGKGFDLQFASIDSNGGIQGFNAEITELSTDLAVAILGQNLTTDVKGGSFAAASVHDRVRLDILESDAESLATCARSQTIKPWTHWNYDDLRLAPWATWDTRPPEDRKLKAETLRTVGESVTALRNAGIRVDAVAIAAQFGVPLEQEDAEDKAEDEEMGEVYQYHLQFGLVTINEARARLGLPLWPDGDRPPEPLFLPGTPATEALSAKRRITMLAAPKNPALDNVLEALRPERLTAEVAPVMEKRMAAWAKKQLRELGVAPRFDLLNPLIPKRVEEIAGDKIEDLVHETTKDALRKTLNEGVRAGEGVPALAKRVREVFDVADESRSVAIARTEVVGASGWATEKAFHVSGVVDEKQWVSTHDGRARDEHLALEEMGPIPIDKPFRVGTASAMYPGGFGVAELDIQCRCTLVANIKDPVALTAFLAAAGVTSLAAAWKKFDRELVPWEEDLADALRRGFRAQRDEVLAALDSMEAA